jgi:hypothetical protein
MRARKQKLYMPFMGPYEGFTRQLSRQLWADSMSLTATTMAVYGPIYVPYQKYPKLSIVQGAMHAHCGPIRGLHFGSSPTGYGEME